MSDLIPLAELLAEIDREIKRVPACAATLQRARSIALTIPTVDAAPVVRCKDCIFANPVPKDLERSYRADRVLVCEIMRGDEGPHGLSMTWKNGFCDEGRRMDADAPERADHFVDVTEKVRKE